MQETNKTSGSGYNWIEPPDGFSPFGGPARATKTHPRGTPVNPPRATPTQILTWGPFSMPCAINTVGGDPGSEPSQKLEKGDVQGDPFMDIIDGKFRCVYHGDGGLVYIEKDYGDGDPLPNWSNPLIDPVRGSGFGDPGVHSAEKAIPLVGAPRSPLSLQSVNVDTPSLMARNGRYQLHYSSKPGVQIRRYPMDLGHVYCIQRATSEKPGPKMSDWDIKPEKAVFEPHRLWQGGVVPGSNVSVEIATWEEEFSNVEFEPPREPGVSPFLFPFYSNISWDGGVLEQSVLWDPDLNLYVMFYDGFTRVRIGDEVGEVHRLGRAFSKDGETWWRDPAPSPTSYVWSAGQDTPKPWGKAKIAHHFAVTRAPDGVYHLAMLGQEPNRPTTQGIGHWYSTEKGAKGSWIADPDNPLITWRKVWPLGSLAGSNNRLGSPNFFFDYQAGKVYLSFDGNGVLGRGRYKAGSRIYVAEAQLPLPGAGNWP